jgi:hypothetical protein
MFSALYLLRRPALKLGAGKATRRMLGKLLAGRGRTVGSTTPRKNDLGPTRVGMNTHGTSISKVAIVKNRRALARQGLHEKSVQSE